MRRNTKRKWFMRFDTTRNIIINVAIIIAVFIVISSIVSASKKGGGSGKPTVKSRREAARLSQGKSSPNWTANGDFVTKPRALYAPAPTLGY